jgi:hypothetical protein
MTPELGNLFGGGASGPGVTPRAKLAKGAPGAGDSGGLGGLGGDLLAAAGAALGLGQPDPLTDALVSVQMQLAAAPMLGWCRLQFLPRSDFPALATGDPITVSLSDAAAPVPVFAGTVAQLAWHDGRLDVLLSAPAAALARIRRNAGYENQSFSDLLNTFAADAGLAAGEIDAGPDYAFFAVDDRLSLWDWIARLARHGDMPAWTDAQGRLNARPPRGQPVATFIHGQTLLALLASSRDPATTAARIVGEGSAGRQGSDAWAWLAKDPQGVSAGGAAGAPVQSDGALRSLSALVGAAAGSAAPADGVHITVPGTPAIDVASIFKLEKCPGGVGDGSWSAIDVRHRFDAQRGFTTQVIGVPA